MNDQSHQSPPRMANHHPTQTTKTISVGPELDPADLLTINQIHEAARQIKFFFGVLNLFIVLILLFLVLCYILEWIYIPKSAMSECRDSKETKCLTKLAKVYFPDWTRGLLV